MKAVGIVAEYNPFHNGHKYHIEKSKELTGADKAIVVMSSNFVQRGEPAVFDKWERTMAALKNGADVVIELPVYFSTSSAEFFAKGAVDLLNKTNCVDYLCFGAENDDISSIKKAAEILSNETEEFKDELKKHLDMGVPFPAARSKALKKVSGISEDFLSSPNNILAVEYAKALLLLGSKTEPVAIKRMFVDYHSTSAAANFASATGIRKMLKNYEDTTAFLPHKFFASPVFPNSMSEALGFKIRSISKADLSDIVDISEGLENRIIDAAGSFLLFSDIVSAIKTKRYTQTRIQRALTHILLDINKPDFNEILSSGLTPYIRILGFKKESQDLVSKIAKSASVPVITTVKSRENVSDLGKKMLEKESSATDIYNFIRKETTIGADTATPMVII